MNQQEAAHTLVESFNALADEVQSLIDRKTILEHKLRYAHEQYQLLADKYAPVASEVAETLAKLQLPPDLHQPAPKTSAFVVPLPKSCQANGTQLQIALCIREGRKAAQKLSSLDEPSLSSRPTVSPTAMTSISEMVLEQDFTVEGKKGKLSCPFSAPRSVEDNPGADEKLEATSDVPDPTPHKSTDPICAAMLEEPASQQEPTPAVKCPIRFLDKHSPEEIAHYVETHKHEIPRSHEVCVRRYQRNEEQIRKLDAKYGNLASMIQDLSHLHTPMLPTDSKKQQEDVDRASNERVESWAQAVSASAAEPDRSSHLDAEEGLQPSLDRESHFDRQLKEVRVGESPSRPWGISVPIYEIASQRDDEPQRPVSPPPAPVRMPSPENTPNATPPAKVSKCPFGYTSFDQGLDGATPSPLRKMEDQTPLPATVHEQENGEARQFQPSEEAAPRPVTSRPAFINPGAGIGSGGPSPSQMVFTGPVFIGYPIEQAIQFMQHFQQQQH